MTENTTFPDYFEIGRQCLEKFRAEFAAYGIETDPEMEVRKGAGLLCYYDFNDRQIYLSMPDFSAPTAKLQLLMLRQMVGADSNESLMRFLSIFIPFVVAHEMTHHFRHRYGLFSEDSWHEEQLANKMAAAVNKHRILPEDKAFALQFLGNSMRQLAEKIGVKEDAVDSYYDIAHALHTSEQLSNEEMINFRMAQGLASDSSSATMILSKSGNLAGNVQDRLQKRRELISVFNEQYASDAARYFYYQIGWVFLALKSQESSYVEEFARRHLGMTPKFLTISLHETYKSRAIYACYKASQQTSATFPTLSRYFYKRYRALLLDYLKKNRQAMMRDMADPDDLNFDFLSAWNDRINDPINFMISMVSPFAREIFPSRITRASILPDIKLPEDLPTEEDQLIWAFTENKATEHARNTVRLFEQFDNLDLFRSLPPEVMTEIAKKLYTVRYASDETLVWEGESNNDVFILLEGRLDVIFSGKPDVSVINPGEVFGEIAWLTKGTRVATVRASVPSICLVIKENDLRLLCYQNPGILMAIAGRTAQRFREMQ